jgi:hypothetical protein
MSNQVPISDRTLRDYFAARAPECPYWFEHSPPPKREIPPMPDYLQLDESHQQIAKSWQEDPIFDLPPELEFYGKKVQAHREATANWHVENSMGRITQWRFAYADAMMKERAHG